MKRFFLAALLSCGAAQAVHAGAADAALQAAIGGDWRGANASRDGARHPYETLRFFGIAPGMTVVELAPGGGWYTEILAPYLRGQGQLIAAGNDPQSADEGVRRGAARFAAKLAARPAVFDRVRPGVFEPERDDYRYAAKGSADMVLTFRNIHNWIPLGPERLKTLFAGVYDSLKPGGVFGVVEHRLPAARAQDATASTGYLHEAYVIALAEGAGFRLAGRAEINANPRDTAEHPNGVWALPPTYANKDAGRAGYAAIGESDRMTLKFVKP